MELRDKIDKNRGLLPNDSRQITTFQHTIQIDSRDCVGTRSLENAKQVCMQNGLRADYAGNIRAIYNNLSSLKIAIVQTNQIKNGDFVVIKYVQGIPNANGLWKVTNFVYNDLFLPFIGSSFEISCSTTNNYAGGGQFFRAADNGYPVVTDTTSIITGNTMIIPLQKRLKAIRSIALNLTSVPRDIIPLQSYINDILTIEDISPFNYISYIPNADNNDINGLYSTCLSIFRTYNGNFKMNNNVTPPPLNLWNPPLIQPLPYPSQTVPSLTSSLFGNNYYITCSGYGVYDLNDWTALTRDETEIARKKLLSVIVRPQMLNGLTLTQLINLCSTTSNDISPFGYGNFQRFLCGPGIQLNYQPGTSDGANPTIPAPDWPVAFPDFRGNVWGPYDAPGDRFQKLGLRDTIQDLFMNGDLNNLYGTPIINPNIHASEIMTSPNYGIQSDLIDVTFGNMLMISNLNILNSMRIVPNGFGGSSVFAQGQGNPYKTSVFQSSGGIGPSSLGAPSAWSLTGVFGVPTLSDPNAVGPNSFTLLTNGTVPQTSVGNIPNNYANQQTSINHRAGWYDLGPNKGNFMSDIQKYFLYLSTNLPPNNLVIQVFQFPRNERVQSSNSQVATSIFNIPIRLFPGGLEGNFEYVEGLYALLSQSSDFEYWGQRFLTPMASLDRLTLKFSTYDGTPIDLEKVLSYSTFTLNPGNPLLNSKKSLSLLFRIECYQYVNLGIHEVIDNILKVDDDSEFNIRAENYESFF